MRYSRDTGPRKLAAFPPYFREMRVAKASPADAVPREEEVAPTRRQFMAAGRAISPAGFPQPLNHTRDTPNDAWDGSPPRGRPQLA
jgi:hypothetical protein